MNIIEFLRLVNEIRNNCGLDCTYPTYYIFINKDLRTATVNKTGYANMVGVECVIVVCAYKWENMGYVNTSLTQLVMVDNLFNPIDGLQFGDWTFKGLGFTTRFGDYYNKWKPYPKLELTSDPSINNYEPMDAEQAAKFPDWTWTTSNVDGFAHLLNEIHSFAEANRLPRT